MDNLLLTEKYRPKEFKNVIGNAEIISSLEKMSLNKQMPHLLFFGPPGTGKTTSAKIISNKNYEKENVLELNASNDRGIDVVRNEIKNFAQKSTNFKQKLIILDECDSMTTAAQQALRKIMETHTKETRFILICNNFEKVFSPIQSRCSIFKFDTPTNAEIKEKIFEIIEKENFSIEEHAVDLIIDHSFGDVRKVLNNLQNAFYIKDLTFEICLKIFGIPSPNIIKKILGLCEKKEYEKSVKIFNTLWEEGYEPTDLIDNFFREARNKNNIEVLKVICKYQSRIISGIDSKVQFLAMLSEIERKCV